MYLVFFDNLNFDGCFDSLSILDNTQKLRYSFYDISILLEKIKATNWKTQKR